MDRTGGPRGLEALRQADTLLVAGIDLFPHIIRTDYGAAIADEVARFAPVALVRPGGRTPFRRTPLPPERGTSCADTRGWAIRHLHRPLTPTDLARHAGISVRTLTRRAGHTPSASPDRFAPTARE
ncbi:hypothetical protein ACE1SV_15120 [Streptomyces sp. E-15]